MISRRGFLSGALAAVGAAAATKIVGPFSALEDRPRLWVKPEPNWDWPEILVNGEPYIWHARRTINFPHFDNLKPMADVLDRDVGELLDGTQARAMVFREQFSLGSDGQPIMREFRWSAAYGVEAIRH